MFDLVGKAHLTPGHGFLLTPDLGVQLIRSPATGEGKKPMCN
jgi:hypothetical protein